MKRPVEEHESGPDGDGMLDEPSLSRQWVARRLQRALSVERWCGPLRTGFGAESGEIGQILQRHAQAATRRAERLEGLIRGVGSEPYRSRGFGARAARGCGRIVRLVSSRLTRKAARMVGEHTLSEYETLEAFVRDAPGVDPELGRALGPMHREVAAELAELDFKGA